MIENPELVEKINETAQEIAQEFKTRFGEDPQFNPDGTDDFNLKEFEDWCAEKLKERFTLDELAQMGVVFFRSFMFPEQVQGN